MDLDRYVEELRGQMMATAEAGGEESRALAERLVPALESSVRLVLLEALSDAASEITVDLAPGSVEVRLRGRQPEIVVTPPPTEDAALSRDVTDVMATPTSASEAEDGGTARITLRLPESLKVRLEDAANRQSLSVNSWLVRAVTAAVDPSGGPTRDAGLAPSVGSRFTGWAR
jgi:hypothetical protein